MHKDLFIGFFRAGMLGYGGGLSAVPLMHKEVVKTYKWMGDDEFSDILALANTLPGPINTKLSGYIGWRLKGFWGLITCIIATVLPTALLMILLLTVLNAYKDVPWVQGMAKGVLPIAGVMIGVLAWDFIKKSRTLMGWGATIILTIISIVVMQVLGIHPAFLIIALILSALFSKSSEKERQAGES
ncbi:chromate transporter [Virgibacillus dakarensis]|uniref:Transporter YwrA n=1 Tax=Lentibacillus populi TaxID=1827502 RepID=A0A9W5TYU9_9BACI|nr:MULTISPECIES: chromate transporter [Bacillaceae]MBT2216357.1 chromate transporter [Virgibacillus dakarensis]MTW86547.1 chromate transporter [Virgibacillus dakarensis]GGB46777.1 putative transporter YwrA [Lentibacillus populi]